MNCQKDTITAIATPVGIGGLAIVRISGNDAISICEKVFRGSRPLSKMKGYTAQYGKIVNNNGEEIDEVIVTVFTSPYSYTTEDMIEISCHGGILVTNQILESILQAGARLAQPGEFTKRAFLYGRIDLTQAEAIADLIQSNSVLSQRTSLSQLEGRLSSEIKKLREPLINMCSYIELELDFAEEGLEFQSRDNLKESIKSILTRVKRLIDTYSVGKIYREGVKTVIVGKPNVGKSSILNNLLNENRAIVTAIPGTTRDIIEENLSIGGILFKVVDTAGFRKTNDPVEIEGVIRAKKQLESADLILIVLDHTQGFDGNDLEIIELSKKQHICKNILCVINKIDLPISQTEFMQEIEDICIDKIKISAKTGIGISELKDRLVKIVTRGKVSYDPNSIVIINTRHKMILQRTKQHLTNAIKSIEKNVSSEFIALDIRAALNTLGELIGEVTTDDILNNIFNKFCIGK